MQSTDPGTRCKRQCTAAVPNTVQQALMLLKGQAIFIYAAPLWQQFCSQALCFGRGPAERRTEQDKGLAVVARPKLAVALRLLVWKRDLLVCTEDGECFIANCDVLARMHLRVHDVLPPGTIVHAWLYSTRSGQVCLGAYDLIACEQQFLHGRPPFERSARLCQLFAASQQRAASQQEQRFEYFWVGQLGSDAALAANPALPVSARTCTGACEMLYDARCPYDVDVFVTVPECCDAPLPVRWIDSTPVRNTSQAAPRERAAALRIEVPRISV